MAIKKIGTREQKENKAGKTGTKTVFMKFLRIRITKIDKIRSGNKRKQEKFLGNKGT